MKTPKVNMSIIDILYMRHRSIQELAYFDKNKTKIVKPLK